MWYFPIFFLSWNSHFVHHRTLDFSEHLCDSYFELSVRQIIYLRSTWISFWKFILISLFFYFSVFSFPFVLVSTLDKTAISPILDRLASCRRWSLPISPAKDSQTFVLVQTAICVLSGPWEIRVCHVAPVPWRHRKWARASRAPGGLPNACPLGSQVQANWEPNLQAAAGKVGTFGIQSGSFQGGTGSWVFLSTLSVLSQGE